MDISLHMQYLYIYAHAYAYAPLKMPRSHYRQASRAILCRCIELGLQSAPQRTTQLQFWKKLVYHGFVYHLCGLQS